MRGGRTTPCKTIASGGGGEEEGVVRLHLTEQGRQFNVGPWELAENGEKEKEGGRTSLITMHFPQAVSST